MNSKILLKTTSVCSRVFELADAGAACGFSFGEFSWKRVLKKRGICGHGKAALAHER